MSQDKQTRHGNTLSLPCEVLNVQWPLLPWYDLMFAGRISHYSNKHRVGKSISRDGTILHGIQAALRLYCVQCNLRAEHFSRGIIILTK